METSIAGAEDLSAGIRWKRSLFGKKSWVNPLANLPFLYRRTTLVGSILLPSRSLLFLPSLEKMFSQGDEFFTDLNVPMA